MKRKIVHKVLSLKISQQIINNCNLMTLKSIIFIKYLNLLNSDLNRRGFSATVSARPVENKRIYLHFNLNPLNTEWGIVFHGKIVNKRTLDFLLENIRATRDISPYLKIVVSTYEDEYYLPLESSIQDLDVVLIKCTDAGELTGGYPKSLCQQIETISSGLLYLQENGSRKSIKIRVDQKIDIETTIRLLESLISRFPSRTGDAVDRLWTTSYNSYLRRPLGASDMLMAGYTSDLLKYWAKISTVEWMQLTDILNQEYCDSEYNGFKIPETWLGARYLFSKGIELTSPKLANEVFWKDYMGVINSAHLNHSWLKSYKWLGSNFHTLNWFGELLNESHSEITFEDWSAIYSDLQVISRFSED